MVEVVETVLKSYVAIDGESFKSREDATDHEAALDPIFRLRLLLKPTHQTVDFEDPVSRLWTLRKYLDETVHVPERAAGFLRPYEPETSYVGQRLHGMDILSGSIKDVLAHIEGQGLGRRPDLIRISLATVVYVGDVTPAGREALSSQMKDTNHG